MNKSNIGFAVACLIILLIGVVSNISTSELVRNSESVIHTMSVKNELDGLHILHLDEIASLRAYYLIKDANYLEKYEENKEKIPLSLERIQRLVKDNPHQLLEMEKLSQFILLRQKLSERQIQVRQTKGLKSLMEMGTKENAKELNENLIASILKMKRVEDSLLRARLERAERTVRRATYTISIGTLLALLMILGASFTSYRDSRMRAKAEAEMERFFTLTLDMLCISGMDGYFKRLSPAFEKTLGYSLKELYSAPVVDFIHPDDVDKTVKEIERQSQGHTVMAFENRFRCKDGSYKLLSWKSVPQDKLMYAVARDVTKQKEFEEELFSAQKQAQAAAKAKSEFIANVSHEIRTPLNGIIGVVDLMRDTGINQDQKKFLDVIRNSGNILLSTINEVLDFSKIESGKMEIENHEFELRQVIESQISLAGVSAHEKKLFLTSSIDSDIPQSCWGDPNRISQVLLNLLNNAIKFTEKGGIEVKASFQPIRGDTGFVKIEVKDTGIGISSQQTEKLFSPFTQADGSTARKFGGTGLGLSICKRLVGLMGGQIGVDSQAGVGSRFWFTVVVKVQSQNAISTKAVVQSLKNSIVMKLPENLKILVAEDNHVNQMIVAKMLEKLGCTADIVANGREAVEAFSKKEYDLILMDQHMPFMNGIEAASQIRNMEKVSGDRIPIIAFTANVLQKDQKESLAHLIDAVLLKPVTMSALEKCLSPFIKKV